MPALPEDAEVEHYERYDGQDSCSQGRMADVTQGVPPDIGRVEPQLGDVVLDTGLVVVAHLVLKTGL